MTHEQDKREPLADPAIEALYRATRREQPSSVLDERILDEAHRQAHRRRRRWALPLSTVALVVLGLTLVLRIEVPPPVQPTWEEAHDHAETSQLLNQKAETDPVTATPAPQEQKMRSAPPDSATEYLASPAPVFQDRPATSEEAVSSGRRRLNSEAARRLMLTRSDPKKTPERWLNDIQVLMAADHKEQAWRALTAFRQRYPEYPLPTLLAKFEAELKASAAAPADTPDIGVE